MSLGGKRLREEDQDKRIIKKKKESLCVNCDEEVVDATNTCEICKEVLYCFTCSIDCSICETPLCHYCGYNNCLECLDAFCDSCAKTNKCSVCGEDCSECIQRNCFECKYPICDTCYYFCESCENYFCSQNSPESPCKYHNYKECTVCKK
jgi:hypothetical protein